MLALYHRTPSLMTQLMTQVVVYHITPSLMTHLMTHDPCCCLRVMRVSLHGVITLLNTHSDNRPVSPFFDTPCCVSSSPDVHRRRQSGVSSLNAKATTAFWCPVYSLFTSPVCTVHSRATLSDDTTTNTHTVMLSDDTTQQTHTLSSSERIYSCISHLLSECVCPPPGVCQSGGNSNSAGQTVGTHCSGHAWTSKCIVIN